MKKLNTGMISKVAIALVLGLAALAVISIQSTAGAASPNTKLDMLQDVADGSGDARDVVGPAGFGHINYNQLPSGDLRIEAALKGAAPDTTYTLIIYCGPTHINAINSIHVGAVTTNGQGNANTGAIHIPAASLAGATGACASGATTGHLDFDNNTTSGTYTSPPGSITYTTP